MRRILGIDPGLNRTGYGIIRDDGRRVFLEEGGVIATTSSDPLAIRVAEIAREMEAILEQWQPQVLAIEQIFSLMKNPKSAILLAHARGAILAVAGKYSIPVHHYKPTEIKRLLTGHGRASKEQMQLVIRTELGLAEVPRPHDVADALAIALCHAHNREAA